MARWYITDHAVEQFCMRVDPRATYTDARVMLERGAQSSARLNGKTYGGESRYLLQEPKCIAIVKHENGILVAVTILSATGDQGRKWVASNEPASAIPDWKPDHHPFWKDLREETTRDLAMMFVRLARTTDVRAPIVAWIGDK